MINDNQLNEILDLEIPVSLSNRLLLHDFLQNQIEVKKLHSFEGWVVDEVNYSICNQSKTFNLTKKEFYFLKILLDKRVVTYEEMLIKLWKNSEEITKNAILLFVKNFRKKLPSRSLINHQGIGYRLIGFK
ncbi:MAG: winged helix-turn-helix transcriptional regulator [Campylobacteraceae bacterium]|nr:winged helix-turn-helix transcriptional regulator [Campylobacteraceae bacterium]